MWTGVLFVDHQRARGEEAEDEAGVQTGDAVDKSSVDWVVSLQVHLVMLPWINRARADLVFIFNPTRTEIIILATRTQNVLGEKGRRIRELTAVVQKRFGFPEGSVELYAEKVATRGLCAIAQAESLRYKLLGGLAVRRACYGVLRFIMESGAKGCEVVVSGKLRGQRAKSMKFVDGLMIHSGDPVNYYVDTAVRHVLLRQGVLGIKVKIMLPWDPSGKIGPKKPLPDHVSIVEPKDEILPTTPISEQKGGKPEPPAMPQPVPTA